MKKKNNHSAEILALVAEAGDEFPEVLETIAVVTVVVPIGCSPDGAAAELGVATTTAFNDVRE